MALCWLSEKWFNSKGEKHKTTRRNEGPNYLEWPFRVVNAFYTGFDHILLYQNSISSITHYSKGKTNWQINRHKKLVGRLHVVMSNRVRKLGEARKHISLRGFESVWQGDLAFFDFYHRVLNIRYAYIWERSPWLRAFESRNLKYENWRGASVFHYEPGSSFSALRSDSSLTWRLEVGFQVADWVT